MNNESCAGCSMEVSCQKKGKRCFVYSPAEKAVEAWKSLIPAEYHVYKLNPDTKSGLPMVRIK